MNTYQKGSVRTIIFKDKDTWVGVALEFNIVETGDDPREVFLMLDEAIRGYIISAKKSKIPDRYGEGSTDRSLILSADLVLTV